MLFFHVTHLLMLLFVAAFWIFVLYIGLRTFQALRGIEKGIAEIAETLRTKN
jgi:hypothetical protein